MGEAAVLDTPGTLSGPELAETLGVPESTLHRWARLIGYPPVGSGNRRRYTDTDLLVCRAVQVLTSPEATQARVIDDLRRHAVAAIRRRPARWLLVTPRCGFTLDTAEDATRLALSLGLSSWWLIDLWSRHGA